MTDERIRPGYMAQTSGGGMQVSREVLGGVEAHFCKSSVLPGSSG